MAVDLPPATEVTVVVLFSCHCFSREPKNGEVIPVGHLVEDGTEKIRMLDEVRYKLSKHYLPKLIAELSNRHIKIADSSRPNFVTFEPPTDLIPNENRPYSIFFEVVKDSKRKRRLLLRVQSAYLLDNLTKQLKDAKKMNFPVILRRAYKGEK